MNGERTGWVFSAALHIGVAVAAIVGLPHLAREHDPTPPPMIDIEFVKIQEQTEVIAPKEEKQQEESQPEPEQQVAKAEPIPEDVPDVVPLPKPEPEVKKDLPKPQPKPEISEREKLRDSITVQTKPKAPSRLKSASISSVIDKALKEEKLKTQADEKKEEKVKAKEEAKADPFAGIRGRLAAASLQDALSQKLARCWTFPRGAKGIEDMQVTVRIHLRPDGNLARSPEFLDAGDLNDPSRGFYRTFVESARRAVQLCQPYTEAIEYLPSGMGYIDFNFSGAEFAGG